MAYTLSTGARNVLNDHHSAEIYDDAVLEIRTGSPPGPDAAATGTLLASITLPSNAHGASAAGVAALAGTWEDSSADASGTAGHFRIRQSGDDNSSSTSAVRAEGTITQTGGGGDLELDNPNIAAGQAVQITTWGLTQPAS